MRSNVFAALATFAVVVGMSAAPVSAGGLLGGVVDSVVDTVTDTVDTVTDTVGGGGTGGGTGGGGTNVGGLVSLNDEGNDAVVNLDVGGGNGNILNAAVGNGNSPLVNANVSSTGLLKSTTVSLDLAGLELDLDLDLNLVEVIGGGGGGNGNGNGNGNGGGNGAGGNGAGGNGNRVLVGSLGGANFVINCAVNNTKQLLQIAAAGKISGAEIKAWMRAANVQVVPIKLCPAAKKQVAQILAKSKKINLLRRAVMSDALITASLGRTSYDAKDVVAVQRKGGQLVVYVY